MSESVETATAKKPLWKRWWFIGLIVVFLIVGLARMGKKNSHTGSLPISTPSTPTAVEKPSESQQEKSPKSAQESEPVKVKTGLGVGRSNFSSVLESKEVGFTFREGQPIDGMPNWVGGSDKVKGGVIQMVGESGDLHKISAIALARSGEQDNALSVMMVVAVANITNPEIGSWVKEQIKVQDFQKSFKEVGYFDNAKAFLTYRVNDEFRIEIEAR